MDAFSLLAKVSLLALKPYKDHPKEYRNMTCSSSCPDCRLNRFYWNIKNMCTEIL